MRRCSTCSAHAADSGVFGGTVHEPMTDLFAVFSKLVTGKGEILIPGINDLIAPLTDEERKRYEVMDFNLAVRPRTMPGTHRRRSTARLSAATSRCTTTASTRSWAACASRL